MWAPKSANWTGAAVKEEKLRALAKSDSSPILMQFKRAEVRELHPYQEKIQLEESECVSVLVGKRAAEFWMFWNSAEVLENYEEQN